MQVSFDQQKQAHIDSLRFTDGSTFKEIAYGKGRIFCTAYPVELGQEASAAATVYGYVASKIGVESPFTLQQPISSGVLIYPTVLDAAVMYVVISDAAEDGKVTLRDKATGVNLKLDIAGQHAAIALLSKKEKKVIAMYKP